MEQDHVRHSLITSIVAGVIGLGVVIYTLNYVGLLSFIDYSPGDEPPQQVAATVVPFTQIAQGSESKVSTRVNYVISSQEELVSLWKLIDAKGTPPTIDFSANEVIAVFAGEKNSGGYGIRVRSITDAADRDVTVELQIPSSSCMTASVITTPYQVVSMPVTKLPLSHKDISATIGCTD